MGGEYAPLIAAAVTKAEQSDTKSVSEDLLRLLVTRPSQVVMAPKRKLRLFEERDDVKSMQIDDFVAALNHAYEIPLSTGPAWAVFAGRTSWWPNG